jgi:hypothetical protein
MAKSANWRFSLLCKSARYVASLSLLRQVVWNEARSLICVLLLLILLVVLTSGLMSMRSNRRA